MFLSKSFTFHTTKKSIDDVTLKQVTVKSVRCIHYCNITQPTEYIQYIIKKVHQDFSVGT